MADKFTNDPCCPPPSPLADLLSTVSTSSRVIQDFRPLSQCLEWHLAGIHWAEKGVLPFVDNEVPFVVTSSGQASQMAAAVLFANCRDAASLEPRVNVLELGAGTGLFARQFLDVFQTLCQQEGCDFYQRLTYFVSDRSHRTIQQWQERGVFQPHLQQVVIGHCDALAPEQLTSPGGQVYEMHGLRGVLCNYLLDVLPAAIVRRTPQGWQQLCVRTHLNDEEPSGVANGRARLDEVRRLADSDDSQHQARLISMLTMMEFEAAFLPLDGEPPYSAQALEMGEQLERITLSYGALQCLEHCQELLRRDGFMLISDYGPTRVEQLAAHASSQRFGPTCAFGVNFPLIESHLAKLGVQVQAADGDDEQPIHTRLLRHVELPHTQRCFQHWYGGEHRQQVEFLLRSAREHAAAGRFDEAVDSYQQVLRRNSRDWYLIGEVAEFIGLQLRDYPTALELVRAAIDINPWYSPWLWNVLGDCLFCQQQFEAAHRAYESAYQIDPDDPRTNLNLAYTCRQRGQFEEALHAIARGLAADRNGQLRNRLLDQQQQTMAALYSRRLAEQERLARRGNVLNA